MELQSTSIFHFSFEIFHLPSAALQQPQRLEGGLVRIARWGTSVLSKRLAEKRPREERRHARYSRTNDK
jgi:hypothetical protein